MAKWTQATVDKWLKNKPKESESKDRHIYQQDNLRATVYKSGNLTWYFYRKGTTNLKLGTYPAISLKQAKAMVLKNMSDEFTGENPDGQLTFKEYCNSAKFLREKNKERKSNESSMKSLNNLICPVIGHIRMDKLTLDDINKFKFEYKAKNSSVNRLLNEIRAVLTHAFENKAIKNNIKIKNLDTDSTPDKRYLQESEINELRQACREPLEGLSMKQYLKAGHLPLIIDIALFCGCRLGEILQVTYADIKTWDETKDNSWKINLRAEITKSGNTRDVLLPEWLKDRLSKWWFDNLTEQELEEVRHDRATKKRPRLHHDKRLFPYKSIQTAFEKARDRAELDKDISFHSLRHHFCSNALICGVPIHLVQKMAGHSSITTTEKYLHIIDEDSAKYMEQYWKSVYRYEEPKKKTKKSETIISIGGTAVPTLVQPQTNITIDTHKIDWSLDDALAKAIAAEPIPIVIDANK